MLNEARVIIPLLALLAVGWSAAGKGDSKQMVEGKNSGHPLSLCEVLSSPERYSSKTVAVRGTYRVGYEASELYCLSCSGGLVWLEFDLADHADKAAKEVSRLMHHGNGTVNGVFTGVFHSGGSYGHLGAYRNKLSVESVSSLSLVDRLGLPPSKLSGESRNRVCQ
jgi:hypothetical protein